MKDIQKPLVKFKEIKGVDLQVEEEAMVMVERMEEDMMVIIKVIAEVEVVSEAEVGEQVMVEVITTKSKSQNHGNNQTKVTKIRLKIKIKQMMVIMRGRPLVIISKDTEKVHSVFIVKGVVLFSTIGHINVIG